MVCYVSVPDNAVATVHSGFRRSSPTVTRDKTTVYSIGRDSPHTVYVYTKASGWAPLRIGVPRSSNGWHGAGRGEEVPVFLRRCREVRALRDRNAKGGGTEREHGGCDLQRKLPYM